MRTTYLILSSGLFIISDSFEIIILPLVWTCKLVIVRGITFQGFLKVKCGVLEKLNCLLPVVKYH